MIPGSSLWRMKKLLRSIFGLAAVSIIGLAVSGCTDAQAQRFLTRMKGKPAPDFSLTTLEGKTVRLADLRGKTVLLAFWGMG